MSQCFAKSERLRKRVEFLSLGERGNKASSRCFLVISGTSGFAATRIGITVTKKIGNAVTRNRVKRLIREFYRQNKALFTDADYNIVARQGAAHLDFAAVSNELGRLLGRISYEHDN